MDDVRLVFASSLKPLATFIGFALVNGLYGPAASAACATSSNVTTCNTNAPSPWTSTVGQGPATPAGATVTLAPSAQIVTGNANAISLGDNTTINIGAGALVQNKATSGAGLSSAGNNTVEFGSNGNMTVGAGASVKSTGSARNAEAINVIGTGNTITNFGLISGVNSAAIWFEDRTIGTPNTVDNYGTIQTGSGAAGSTLGNVIGNSSHGNVNFINRTGATVQGSLSFASGNDSLTLEAGSVITGSFDGGGGTNTLTLSGVTGSSDTLPGNISNFQTLTKTGAGTWTLSGTVGNNAGTPLAVDVQQGTLALTGNNASFNGSVLVEGAGTLQARAQSLPPTVTDNGLVLFAQPDNGTYAGLLKGTGAVTKTGVGVLTLSGNNTYQGNTLIQGGAIAISADSGLGGASGAVTLDGGALELQRSFNLSPSRAITVTPNNGAIITDAGVSSVLGQPVAGAGSFTKGGAGTLALTNTSTYAGSTTIAGGTLQLGNGGTTGSLPGGAVTDNGILAFNRSDQVGFGNPISGSGGVIQNGSGTTILTASNSYGGVTNVDAGALYVNGNQAGTGTATVASGATLGGAGALGGSVAVGNGGTLSPGDVDATPGTLTIGGDLSLGSSSTLNYSFGQAGQVGGPLNDLTDVGGNLTLGGTLNVVATPGGTFSPGLYRVISYAGALGGGGLALGTVPTPGNYFIQTSIPNQVNLINTSGLTLNYWDGQIPAQRNNGSIDGGNGTWTSSLGNDNWTNESGLVNAPYSNGAFAIFVGAPGTVTVDTSLGAVQAAGMQFGVDGYNIVGNPLTLTGGATPATGSVIRVGDGTRAGAGYTATIAAPVHGSATLVKSDLGTLVLSGANTYTGGTQINGGTLQVSQDANLGASGGALGLDGGALHTTQSFGTLRNTTLEPGGGTFDTDAGTTLAMGDGVSAAGMIGGAGGLVKTGGGTLALAADNTYTGGTTIEAGTLQLGAGTATGSIAGDVTDNGTLAFNRADTFTFGGIVSGAGALAQTGSGTTVLTAANTYTGGTTISAGGLQLGNGGASGSIVGNVTDNGSLTFNRSDSFSFGGAISGTGSVTQSGTGTTDLSAANSYTGATTVNAGALYIDGDQSLATGTTTVGAATLGGAGTIGGSVNIAGNGSAGGTLSPGTRSTAPGTLTINGNLSLASNSSLDYRFGAANTVGGAFNDLTNVGGNLTLGGTLNVTLSPGGSFDPGVYRVINYGGTLTSNTLSLGTVPAGSFFVQTSVSHEVNLINTTGVTLNYWDGGAGPKNNSSVDGGSGVWNAAAPGGNDNWTDQNGTLNAPWANQAFAIFMSTPGTVTVDSSTSTGNGPVVASGMQFASNGYVINGNTPADAITLVGTGTGVGMTASSVIRVGDGTAQGAGYTATINAQLTGASQLVKTDLGTLILEGANTYTGGTAIDGGVLQIAADNNLGAPGTALSVDSGTLRTTADMTSARATTLGANGGTFDVTAGTTLELDAAVGGTGALSKTSAGALVLAQDNVYSGGTIIGAGTLQLGNGGTSGSVIGNVTDNGTLAFDRSDAATFGGLISGTGSVNQLGSGTTIFTADNTYSGGTTISGGTLQLGNGGTSGSVIGNVTDSGTLAFDRSDAATFGGLISGTGSVNQLGSGTTIFTADNTYSGGTTISAGTLQLGNGGTSGSIAGNVTDNATLAFRRADTVTFAGVIGGSGTLNQLGTGTTMLTGDNTYGGGTTIGAGTLQLGNGGTSGSIVGDVTDEGILAVDRADTLPLGGRITGAGALLQQGTGTTVLTGFNTYSGGTIISGGTLQLGNGGATGSITGDVLDNGTLTFNRADLMPFVGTISGSGAVVQQGSGTTVLSGANAYGGPTLVTGGALFIDGDQSGAAGPTTATGGATLGGTGTIGGDVAIVSGGTLSPGDVGVAPGTLTINRNLTLNSGALLSYSFGQANVVGGPLNDLTVVKGNLTLAGTLNVQTTEGGTFDPGIYRVFSYTGSLTNNGLALAAIPSPDFTVQTSVDKQVNLVNPSGLALNFWDGAAGPKNDSSVNGGDGVWQNFNGNNNWSNPSGALNGVFADASFAVFMAKPGTVTVDDSLGSVHVSGMQFASDGYVVKGAPITLIGTPQTQGAAVIRVGDGSSAGAAYTATIDSVLTGTASLVKSDIGTLVLNAANTYTGGTAINGGVLQIAGDANLGASAGALSLNGGTLRTTASFSESRATTLGDLGGTFDTAAGTQFTLATDIGGSGSLTKMGAGTTILTGTNTYVGGTTVSAGTLQLGNGGASGSVSGDIRDNATLTFDRSDQFALAGAVFGTGRVIQQGSGTTILNANNTYLGTTTVNAGTLAVGDAAHSSAALSGGGNTIVRAGATLGGYGSVTGNVMNLGTIAVADAIPAFGNAAGNVAAAAAAGGATAHAQTTPHSAAQGATDGGTGNFNIVGNLANAGLVQLGGPGVGNTLTVAGNYVGQQGAVALNAKLGADNSPADRLVISGGSATGSTMLKVTNVGGAGDQTVSDGIQVVQATNGATTAPGAFTGGPASAGAYTYQLFRGGIHPGTEDNWYLRSALMPNELPSATPTPPPPAPPIPIYRAAVPVYAEVPSLARELMVQQIGTFHDRMGSQDLLTETGTVPASWGRLWGDHLSEDHDGTVSQSFSGTVMGAQAGQDVYADSTASGHRNHYGFFLGYARASGDVKGFALAQPDFAAGSLSIDSYSAGAYWTHVGPGGWYTDTVLMGSTMTINPESNAGDHTSTHANAFTASLEGGLPIALQHNLTVEPQAQLVFEHTHINDLNDGVSSVSWSSANELIGRLGVRLAGQLSGHGMQWQPYLRLDVLRYFGGHDQTTFANHTTIDSNAGSTQGHVGVGVSAHVNNRVSVYATAGYWFNLGTSHRATVEGNAGVRLSW
ncbi:Outer membrane autotransporter barrel domain protein (fragment) [Paraburkholderia piptadeniae]|uniref:Outer membrane autotransporter barrel domain protein n=1 Tax=Paraburkholderia piptadeniae TaxID=1701573 RepID=A0A1N7SRG0_9BURK